MTNKTRSELINRALSDFDNSFDKGLRLTFTWVKAGVISQSMYIEIMDIVFNRHN